MLQWAAITKKLSGTDPVWLRRTTADRSGCERWPPRPEFQQARGGTVLLTILSRRSCWHREVLAAPTLARPHRRAQDVVADMPAARRSVQQHRRERADLLKAHSRAVGHRVGCSHTDWRCARRRRSLRPTLRVPAVPRPIPRHSDEPRPLDLPDGREIAIPLRP